MEILAALVPYVALAGGCVALIGGLRCFFDTEKSGIFSHPVTGGILLAWLVVLGPMLTLWSGRGRGAAAAIIYMVPLGLLHVPLLAYHATQLFGRILSPVSQPAPEPTDPLERAKAAEERGDVTIAVERYLYLLEREPDHLAARTRLAGLLARTQKVQWSRTLLEQGLALPDLSPETRAEWRALILEWQSGRGGDDAPPDRQPTLKGLEPTPAARLEAFLAAAAQRKDEPVPFDEAAARDTEREGERDARDAGVLRWTDGPADQEGQDA